MHRIEELNRIVGRYDLNGHPFYLEWVAGTLATNKLSAYASEYAHFVGTIADGWETVGEPALAEEERFHETLWADFLKELNGSTEMKNSETRALVNGAKSAFADKTEAVGALYAFESQQPLTARSKLDGLRRYYMVSESATRYFEVHADDWSELRVLTKLIKDLDEKDFAKAKAACENVCKAMWKALDGVYG